MTDEIQIDQPMPDEPLAMPRGMALFGPNAAQLQTAAEALGINFVEIVERGEGLMLAAKLKEEALELELRSECNNIEPLINTVLGCCHITHSIETARSSLLSMIKHNLFETPEILQMVTSTVLGLADSSNNFAGASLNMVSNLTLGTPTEGTPEWDTVERQRSALFEKINEVTVHKRETFALVARINEDLMLRLQQGARTAVDEKRLTPTDVIAPPVPTVH